MFKTEVESYEGRLSWETLIPSKIFTIADLLASSEVITYAHMQKTLPLDSVNGLKHTLLFITSEMLLTIPASNTPFICTIGLNFKKPSCATLPVYVY